MHAPPCLLALLACSTALYEESLRAAARLLMMHDRLLGRLTCNLHTTSSMYCPAPYWTEGKGASLSVVSVGRRGSASSPRAGWVQCPWVHGAVPPGARRLPAAY
jgi:hypothetical protein